jgi:hypothetical protein
VWTRNWIYTNVAVTNAVRIFFYNKRKYLGPADVNSLIEGKEKARPKL